jgi:hypothetical protein
MHTETVKVQGGTLKPWDAATVNGRAVVIAGVFAPGEKQKDKEPLPPGAAGPGGKVLVRRGEHGWPESLRPVGVIDIGGTEHGHYGVEMVAPGALKAG